MSKHITLYNKASSGKIKVLEISVDSNVLKTRWGYSDNKDNWQETSDIIKGKNDGKLNATSDNAQAILEFDRKIKKKQDEGYVTDISKIESKVLNLINWETCEIDKAFGPSKPATSIDDDEEAKIIATGHCRWQRKHNGMCVIVIKGHHNTKIYSRRLEDKTLNFQDFATIINNSKYEVGTILHGELEINDDPDLIKELFGSSPETSIVRRAELKTQGLEPTIQLFDCLYEHYQDVTAMSYECRYKLLKPVGQFIQVVKNYDIKPDAKAQKWEGLVCRDISKRTFIRTDGKVDRKSGAYKQKPFDNLDAVAYNWLTGKGKNNHRPAKLLIGLYDDTGKFIKLGECGSGLTEADKDVLLDKTIKLPCTFELQFEKLSKANKFILPVFVKWRPDKPITECLLSDIK